MQSAEWKEVKDQGMRYFALQRHPGLAGIRQAFSTRVGGVSPPPFASLNLGFSTPDAPGNAEINRIRFLQALDAKTNRLCTLRQVHSSRVHWIDSPGEAPAPPPEGDALVTDKPGVLLGVLTADCTPLLLVDPQKRVVAAVHAGWKGSAAGIIEETLQVMTVAMDCGPSGLIALLGPAIGRCCYQVGPEVRQAFLRRYTYSDAFFSPDGSTSPREARWKLDLPSFQQLLLLHCGLLIENIFTLPLCTSCREDLFYSYRRDGKLTGRMLSVIGFC